jgi:Ni,Fe-hydrogenase I cytochrome b subunit
MVKTITGYGAQRVLIICAKTVMMMKWSQLTCDTIIIYIIDHPYAALNKKIKNKSIIRFDSMISSTLILLLAS